MLKLPPISDVERAELRRLYAGIPRGHWHVVKLWKRDEVCADAPGERLRDRRIKIATCPSADAAEFIAYAHNALPRLFAEIDELRARTRGVPVLGTVS